MARLLQTTSAKERVYQQAVSFFSTNDSVAAEAVKQHRLAGGAGKA